MDLNNKIRNSSVVKNTEQQLQSVREWLSKEFATAIIERATNEASKELVAEEIGKKKAEYQEVLSNGDIEKALQLNVAITTYQDFYNTLCNKHIEIPDDEVQSAVEKARQESSKIQMMLDKHDPGELKNKRFVMNNLNRDSWAVRFAHEEEKVALPAIQQYKLVLRSFRKEMNNLLFQAITGDPFLYLLRVKTVLNKHKVLIKQADAVKELVDKANEMYLKYPPDQPALFNKRPV